MKTSKPQLLAVLFASTLSLPALAGKIGADCTVNGKPLWGKVRFVTNGTADVKVKLMPKGGEELKVKKVDSSPDECGEWQEVRNGQALKVRIVPSGQDVKIKYVDSNPGLK